MITPVGFRRITRVGWCETVCGWTVIAIDGSSVAMCRAAETADLVPRSSGSAGTARPDTVAARSFDLVSTRYPALPKADEAAAGPALLDVVRPEELLVAVDQHLDDEQARTAPIWRP